MTMNSSISNGFRSVNLKACQLTRPFMSLKTKQAYLEPVFDLFPVDEEIDWSCLASCVLEVLVPRKLFLFATRSRHRRLQSQVVPLAEARREDERGRLKDKKEIYFYNYVPKNKL